MLKLRGIYIFFVGIERPLQYLHLVCTFLKVVWFIPYNIHNSPKIKIYDRSQTKLGTPTSSYAIVTCAMCTKSLSPTEPWTIDLTLKLNDGRLSLSLEKLDYATFSPQCSWKHFILECPLYNPIRDKFPSLFKNVVPRSLKSFFQLD